MARLILSVAAAAAALAASGCRATVDPVTMDLTPDQYFQRAIEAADKDDYRAAMKYYEAFLVKFPGDAERSIWASYEIAVLHRKLGNDEKALEALDKLLERYKATPAPGSPPLPPAPRILAEKVRANILKSRKAAPTAASK